MTVEHHLHIGAAGQFADFVAHPPCGFQGHAKRPLQFAGTDTVACRHEKEDRVEPKLHRRAAVLKDGIGAGIEMIATLGAGERLTARDAVEGGFLGALPTDMLEAVADLHDVRQTGVVIGKACKLIANFAQSEIKKIKYIVELGQPRNIAADRRPAENSPTRHRGHADQRLQGDAEQRTGWTCRDLDMFGDGYGPY